mgnify:CR=1 FL=1
MRADAPQFERYWRDKIAEEIMTEIVNNTGINAYGAYLIAKGE